MSKIRFLGYTSNSFASVNNVSFIYENGKNKMLVDCGSTIPFNIHSAVKSLDEINYCFISHSHFDHFLGLPYLLIGRNLDIIAKSKKDAAYVAPDLSIIIEKRLQPLLMELLQTCHPDVKKLKYHINFIDLEDGLCFAADNFKLIVKQVNHTVDTYGFSIIENGTKMLGYTSDTLYDEKILDFFRGSKYMVLEGMTPDEEEKFSLSAKHATFGNAVMAAKEISADFSFVVHLQPRYLSVIDDVNEYFNIEGNKRIGFPKVGDDYVLYI